MLTYRDVNGARICLFYGTARSSLLKSDATEKKTVEKKFKKWKRENRYLVDFFLVVTLKVNSGFDA